MRLGREVRSTAAVEPEAMNRPYLRRGDMAGIVLMAVMCAVIIFVLLALPPRDHNFGFGPEWQCTRMGEGDPICVRLVDNGETTKAPQK
ncbi:hypothetical protein FJ417_23845 [Mesorhizobium sp. B3-1-7]|uniref:hypothetical protein n=1 Tax=Mesorhizobium sp. B3-1-7 TaxID=2589894 RepID=UPI00112B1DD2|nr:hypothetical protein [Mesorhizobium sp. B3-1-7]TPI55670.1 hypothetical protein FJ417_23845 [Mesorhizobium sp. B3-1-7]